MNASAAHPPLLRIGEWTVDVSANRLWREGQPPQALRHKAMALLALLAETPGQVVTRETLEARLWDGNEFVAPQAINNAIWAIRQALGDDPEQPRYLETIPKKGYRLIAPVQVLEAPAAAPARDAESVAPASKAAGRPRRVVLGWVLSLGLGLGLITLVALFVWMAQRKPAAPPPAPPALPAAQSLTQYPGVEFLGALSPDGRQLAFAWWQGQGDAELYVRDAADRSATPRAVGGAQGDVTALAWSADGRRIAYLARRGRQSCRLWVVDLHSGQRQDLAACAPLFTPALAWSDDGRWLVFAGASEPGLYAMPAEGGPPQRLTQAPNSAQGDHQPAWSPDGQRLAFVRQDPQDGSRDLYELSWRDGRAVGEPRRLTRLQMDSLHGLSFAANGQDLILSTTRQGQRTLLRWQRADGSLRPLGLDGSAPQRSRDGRLVHALMRAHVSLGELPLDREGRAPLRLEQALASRRLPAFHVGRQLLAFVARDGDHAQLWLRSADGALREALRLEGQIGRPVWSPEGRHLAFVGSCGSQRALALCLMDTQAKALRTLWQGEAQLGTPGWSPDGRSLAFLRSRGGGPWQPWRLQLNADLQPADMRPVDAAPAGLPGGRLAWNARGLHYLDARGQNLQVWPLPSGQQAGTPTVWPLTQSGQTLLHWELHPQGVLTLTRGTDERFDLWTRPGAPPQLKSHHPLGSFPEFASFSLSPQGAWVEQNDAAHGDLMVSPSP
ncbi:Tol biopolymer transport system component/DNA-binding winged helix-turn-helix (wHTH) protein [Inhella inkyongensis]|uniref:Tol biopolymer transport system component/DNA-binding winged helix-turn-helix (WHTH) protein n=1 Tax=Inhella inkyongensis TaxID=392593 RepID=A0A840S8P1_9BURK|nr:winged helix-turn-helix domain-containing protein [Inhella inkyongensis]MBB5205982.1 Tol biopolymer transport system component/DNA-binding winged helix-turn-helix (wHTH) protein [Inhella inkyongensis]